MYLLTGVSARVCMNLDGFGHPSRTMLGLLLLWLLLLISQEVFDKIWMGMLVTCCRASYAAAGCYVSPAMSTVLFSVNM